jgi:hypothetical protein
MNKVVLHHPQGDIELNLEQLAHLMHRVLSIEGEYLLSIGPITMSAKKWQDGADWVEHMQVDSKSVILIKKKRLSDMKFSELLGQMYHNEVSLEKLVTGTGNKLKMTTKFVYRFSAATAVEGILWAGAKVGSKGQAVCTAAAERMRTRSRPTTA